MTEILVSCCGSANGSSRCRSCRADLAPRPLLRCDRKPRARQAIELAEHPDNSCLRCSLDHIACLVPAIGRDTLAPRWRRAGVAGTVSGAIRLSSPLPSPSRLSLWVFLGELCPSACPLRPDASPPRLRSRCGLARSPAAVILLTGTTRLLLRAGAFHVIRKSDEEESPLVAEATTGRDAPTTPPAQPRSAPWRRPADCG